MNGLSRPPERKTASQLRRELAVAEACEPIEQERDDTRQAYADALASGDPKTIAAAKAVRDAAALRLNDTRKWLRAEARVAVLKGRLARPGGQDDRDKDAAELASLEVLLAPYRELLGTPLTGGPAPAGGTTEAVMPGAKARVKGGL